MGFFDRWEHFEAEEVLSPGGLELLYIKGCFPLQFRALDKLSELRERIGKPILINHNGHTHRGFRTPKENYEVQKGAGNNPWAHSFHMSGCAFDVTVSGMTPEQVGEAAKAQGWLGIGLYNTWTHIDLRDGKLTLWDNRTK